jgi:hypothetical protein
MGKALGLIPSTKKDKKKEKKRPDMISDLFRLNFHYGSSIWQSPVHA